MPVSWCWQAVETTLSDEQPVRIEWSADLLLKGKSQPPRFLVTQWDETKLRPFGSWRLADRTEPIDVNLILQRLLTIYKSEDIDQNQKKVTHKSKLTASLTDSLRGCDRQVIDVQDTDVKSTQANAPDTPDTPDMPDTDTPV
jgi:hypothetical protein